jgi:hypothetical protein
MVFVESNPLKSNADQVNLNAKELMQFQKCQ